MEGPDFIVSELLSELKEENVRKDSQIKSLHRAIGIIVVSSLISILLVIGGCLWYLDTYDLTTSEEWTIEKTAEGTFALVDSSGNVLSTDKEANVNGEVENKGDIHQNENED